MTAFSNARSVSLWMDRLSEDLIPRAPLHGDTETDIAIIGGGFSGLWTAYYLLDRDPSLRVLVVEKEYCGFGASGRNGGWCEGGLAGGTEKYATRSSLDEALRFKRVG